MDRVYLPIGESASGNRWFIVLDASDGKIVVKKVMVDKNGYERVEYEIEVTEPWEIHEALMDTWISECPDCADQIWHDLREKVIPFFEKHSPDMAAELKDYSYEDVLCWCAAELYHSCASDSIVVNGVRKSLDEVVSYCEQIGLHIE